MDYTYDEEAAGHADDFANRIDENGPYIGQFTRVEEIVSANTRTKGMRFEFEVPNGGGKAQFSLYTEKEDGTRIFGFNLVQAMMSLLNLRGLKAQPGKVMQFDEDQGRSVEVDGTRYPELENKDIGVILQKELYTKNDGKDGYRMNLATVFDPVSKLTASEKKERKAKPEKVERIIRSLKTKDSRKKVAAEPGQPAVGAPAGDY
ncbi:MAG TPA: hypothetical protein VF443_06280 [Nitrospira sp.]